MSLAQATKGDMPYQVRSLVRIRATIALEASPRCWSRYTALPPCTCITHSEA